MTTHPVLLILLLGILICQSAIKLRIPKQLVKLTTRKPTMNVHKVPYFFILGAFDTEMETIANILRAKKIRYLYARIGHARVTSGTAYNGSYEDTFSNTTMYSHQRFRFVTVETKLDSVIVSHHCDHHQEGDYGFNKGPELYWEGSSIGQVCKLLDIEPTQELRLVAAGDHCPVYAYKGLCPGIDPDELMQFRVRKKAFRMQVDEETVTRQIQRAMFMIKMKTWNNPNVPHFDVTVPGLSEASMRLGVAISYSRWDSNTGRIKVGVMNGTPEILSNWMTTVAPSKGYVDIYGAPERGYVGAYLP